MATKFREIVVTVVACPVALGDISRFAESLTLAAQGSRTMP